MTRREFLAAGIAGVAGLCCGGTLAGATVRQWLEGGKYPGPTPTPDYLRMQAEATERADVAAQTQATEVAKQGTVIARQTEVRPTAAPTRVATRPATRPAVSLVTGQLQEISKAVGALAYPILGVPSAARQPVFPNVPYKDRPALAEYVPSAANWDYFHTGRGEVALPQYHYRLITGRRVAIPELAVDVSSNGRRGALVLLVNHFGETATWRNAIAENSFTVAGRVWDMSTPNKVTLASQALLDHYVGRMTTSTDGANCSVIEACQQVEWHVIVVGGGKSQVHWAGIYTKGQ